MNIAKFDIFSSHFLFNIQNQDRRKATTTGFVLTLVTILVVFTYFVYLSYHYFTNQIDPKYRSQSLISQSVDLPLINDLIAFRFEYDQNKNLIELEKINNKTYLNHYAIFRYQNKSFENLTVLKLQSCQNPLLSDFTCIDTSPISDQLLELNSNQNIFSQILILTFACYSDYFQQQTPPNCANQTELNNVIGMWKSKLHIKLLMSQYNFTSQQIEINYIDKYLYLSTSQGSFTYLTAQKYLTTIKNGIFFQSSVEYSSLGSYEFQTQQLNILQNYIPLGEMCFQLGNIIQQIDIQYPTFPEVLALVNTIFAISMTLGYLGRHLAQELIKQDFFLLFLQNFYQNSYESILRINNLFQNQEVIFFDKKMKKSEDIEEKNTNQDQDQVSVPTILTKSKEQVDNKQSLLPNQLDFNSYLDEQKEQNKDETPKSIFYSKQISQSDKLINEENTLRNSKITSRKQSHLKNQQVKKNLQNDNLSFKKNEITMTFSEAIKREIPQITNQSNNHLRTENTQQLLEKKLSCKDYLIDRLKVIQDKNNLIKVRKILFSKKCCQLFRKPENEIQNQIKREIEQEVMRYLNIFEVYKDLLFLKKAIMMLLTQQQLAAINFIGCSPPSCKKLNQEKKGDMSKQKQISFLQNQIEILSSIELQSQYFQSYIENCLNSDNLSDLDKRIISSIFKTEQN
ncbi:AMP-binding enzyme family protein (macronuclear) [Tetrahymena thermophila SB210]|uniref:AMP-binding enzyme family protein n=1 Tax=Tetrahymena thermophila (strain SB210) TaxID=312017 RepID=I7MDF6_TETTS|nr:AMP-binding enzyme family protein [Tetrahymena thermophila SB210]EAR87495.2 AMP-binding enzyme family protein [Tetrahymena thermophila SB210]|eukprot:XP_001007740.2 AMP-binding enzyme family protein [Tetrahymena thermophila SB210]